MNNQPTNGLPPQVDQAKRMFNNLSRGRQVAIVAAVVGLLASFLPWWHISVSGGGFNESQTASGWGGWGYLVILAFIVAGAVVLLPVFGRELRAIVPSLPPTVTDARLVLGAGGVAVLGTILYIGASPSTGAGALVPGFSVGPSFGAYLALLCGAAVAVGGYLMQRETSTVV